MPTTELPPYDPHLIFLKTSEGLHLQPLTGITAHPPWPRQSQNTDGVLWAHLSDNNLVLHSFPNLPVPCTIPLKMISLGNQEITSGLGGCPCGKAALHPGVSGLLCGNQEKFKFLFHPAGREVVCGVFNRKSCSLRVCSISSSQGLSWTRG